MMPKKTVPELMRFMGAGAMLMLFSAGSVEALGVAPFVVLPVFTAAAKANDVTDLRLIEEAQSVAERIGDPALKSIALVGIAQAYGERGDLEKANELLVASVAVFAAEAESPSPKDLNRTAAGYFAVGETEKAVELLQRSLASFGDSESRNQDYGDFIEIARLYALHGDAAVARPALQEMTELADGIDDWYKGPNALEKIAIAYAQLDDKAIAAAGIHQIHQRLKDIALSLEDEGRQLRRETLTRFAMAEAWAIAGNTAEAISLLAPVLSAESRYRQAEIAATYALLEDKAAAQSALDQLATVVTEMPESTSRLFSIHGVATAYIDIGAIEAARSFLERAQPNPLSLYSDGLDEEGAGLIVLNRLADVYARMGDVDTQQALLAKAFELFSPIDLPEPNQINAWQALSFWTIADSYANVTDEKAPEARALLLRVAAEGDWDYAYQVYLADMAQAEHRRGEYVLVQQRLSDALALFYTAEQVGDSGRLNALLTTLTGIAAVYGDMPDGTVKREGLRSLTMAADSVDYSRRQQELLSAIALAYSSANSCELIIQEGGWTQPLRAFDRCL